MAVVVKRWKQQQETALHFQINKEATVQLSQQNYQQARGM
jgi:hypothetical protein